LATVNTAKPLAAFLDLIAESEGCCSSPLTVHNGYDVIVSGVDGHHIFTDYATHPFALGRPSILVRAARPALPARPDPLDANRTLPAEPAVAELKSTASGRYQITLPTWLHLSSTYKLGTFAPPKQDLAALYLLDECHATADILALEIPGAIAKAAEIWASFPGNLYTQGGHPLDWLIARWACCLQSQS